MKSIVLVFAFVLSISSFAQDSTKVNQVDIPHIVTKLHFGEEQQFKGVTLKFVEVIQDSRCPKDVTCIWAGEVVVSVVFFKNGKELEQKTLTLSPTSPLQAKLGNLFSSEGLTISGLNVLPYPTSKGKTKVEDYYIQLDIRD